MNIGETCKVYLILRREMNLSGSTGQKQSCKALLMKTHFQKLFNRVYRKDNKFAMLAISHGFKRK